MFDYGNIKNMLIAGNEECGVNKASHENNSARVDEVDMFNFVGGMDDGFDGSGRECSRAVGVGKDRHREFRTASAVAASEEIVPRICGATAKFQRESAVAGSISGCGSRRR